MSDPPERANRLLADLKLRPAITIALIIGLLIPVGISSLQAGVARRAALFEALDRDHERIVQTLAIGMQTPIWDVRPDTGKPMVDVVMRDERVSSVTVTAPLLPNFLSVSIPARAGDHPLVREALVMRGNEAIGRVHVVMSTRQLEAQLRSEWRQLLAISALQLGIGLLLILTLLRYKVLSPLHRLIVQSRALAAGSVATPFVWHRADELGDLGRSFEETRQALCGLVGDLENRNAELRQRETELEQQTQLLRVTLENMTDGISLVDRDLRLRAWNDRFIQLFDFPPGFVHVGMELSRLHDFDVARGRYRAADVETFLETLREGLSSSHAHSSQIETAFGQIIFIRRHPLTEGGFVTTYSDVTEQVQAQRKAEETRQLLLAVMNAVPAILSVKDRDLRYRLVNRQFLDTWQLTTDQVIGRTSEEVFTPECLANICHPDCQVLANGQAIPFHESKIALRTGESRDALTTKVPLRDAFGRISHIVTVILDISERTRAERALRESEELHRLVVDLSPYGIMLHDTDGIIFINPAGAKMFGAEQSTSLIGRHYLEFIAEGEREAAAGRVQSLFEQGAPLPVTERSMVDLSGRCFDASVAALPFRRGGQRLALVMVQDISERKRVEQDRARWLQLFREAIGSIPNGFAIFDGERRLVVCNTAYAQLYDLTPEEFTGTKMGEILPRFLDRLSTIDGKPTEVVVRESENGIDEYWWSISRPIQVSFRDGRWFLVNHQPTAEGGLVVLRTDISEIKRMEQALADSEELYRLLVNLSPCGILLHDENEIVFINPEGCRILGEASAESIVGHHYLEFVAEDEREAALERLQRTLTEENSLGQSERRYVTREGREVVAAVCGVPFRRHDRSLALVMLIDITAVRTAEAEIARQREILHQAEKLSALGSLLAGVAHELNNPLAVVVGRAVMLAESELDPRTAASVRKIRDAAERCARIVKSFLAIARQQSPQRVPVAIGQLIAASLDLLAYSIRSSGIEVALDVHAKLPQTLADPDQLGQVFNNLIVNAQQAMSGIEEQKRLSITAHAKNDRLSITVADNGAGIPEKVLPRIFDPFFTTKPVGVGTGIGLSVCRGIIEAHGGTICAENLRPHGAIFNISLPVIATSNAVQHPEDDFVFSLPGGYSILVVDDETEIGELLRDILSANGDRVDAVTSGIEALDHLSKSPVDIVICDLVMPNMDGISLFRAIKERYPNLLERLIFVTGDTLSPQAKEFLEASDRPVIEKPFRPEDVLKQVQEVLDAVS